MLRQSLLLSLTLLLCAAAQLSGQEAEAKSKDGDRLQAYTPPASSSSFELEHSQIQAYHDTPPSQFSESIDVDPTIYFVPCAPATVTTAELHIRLDLGGADEEYRLGKGLSTGATIELQVSGCTTDTSPCSGSPVFVTTITLRVDGSTTDQLAVIDLLDYYNVTMPLQRISFQLLNYSFHNQPAVLNAIRLRVKLVEDYQLAPRPDAQPLYPGSGTPVVQRLQPSAVTLTQNPVVFDWEGSACRLHFPWYQVQVLRLYNTNAQYSADPEQIDANVDWSKALSYETSSTSAALTLAEGTGYYLWRVRPIGNRYAGGIANPRNWGVWTSTPENTTTGQYSLTSLPLTTATLAEGIFYYEQFDDDKNWIFQRSFTEEGRLAEAMSYANGLLQVEQSQRRLLSQERKLITQTLYDYAGRAALTTLPAAYDEGGDSGNRLEYLQRSLFMQAGGARYTQKHFDEIDLPGVNTFAAPAAVSGGALEDYWDGDDDAMLPDAEGYPYARTQFYNDGTNLARESGGAGAAHRIGGGHTSKTLYGAATDEELIRLFGHEAPLASSVRKVISIDPNTSGTVQYIDKAGNVIATGLVKNTSNTVSLPNPTLKQLDEQTLFADGVVTTSIIGGTEFAAAACHTEGLRAGKTIILSAAQALTLDYSFDGNSFWNECLQICSECDYKIVLRVINADNGQIADEQSVPTVLPADWQTGVTSAEACVESAMINISTTTTVLPPGRYHIERHIETRLLRVGGGQPTMTQLDYYKERAEAYIREQFMNDIHPVGLSYYLDNYLDESNATQSLAAMYEDLELRFGERRLATTTCATTMSIMIPEHDCPAGPCEDPSFDAVAFADELVLHLLSEIPSDKWSNDPQGNSRIQDPGDRFGVYYHEAYEDAQGVMQDPQFNGPHIAYPFLNALGPSGPGDADDPAHHAFLRDIFTNMLKDGYSCESIRGCWYNAVAARRDYTADFDDGPEDATAGRGINLLDLFLNCTGRDFQTTATTATTLHSIALAKPYRHFVEPQATSSDISAYENCTTLALHASTTASPPFAVNSSAYWDFVYYCYAGGMEENAATPSVDAAATCASICQLREPVFRRAVLDAYFRLNPSLDTSDVPVDCIVDIMMANCTTACAAYGDPQTLDAAAFALAARYTTFPLRASVAGADDSCPTNATLVGTSPYDAVTWSTIQNDVIAKVAGINDELQTHQSDIAQTTSTTAHAASYAALEIELATRLEALLGDTPCGTQGTCPVSGTTGTALLIGQVRTLQEQGRLGSERLQLVTDECRLWAQVGAFLNSSCAGVSSTANLDAIIFESLPLSSTQQSCLFDAPPGQMALMLCEDICLQRTTGCGICVEWFDIDQAEVTSQVVSFQPLSCRERFVPEIRRSIERQLQAIIGREQAEIEKEYRRQCELPENFTETLTATYEEHLYHFTLYYYDRAGSLVKTIPPKGIDFAGIDQRTRSTVTTHIYPTVYSYNSIGELKQQETPDGGATLFYYNRTGQLRFSQNTQQFADGSLFSYTKYDALGRIVEVGESSPASDATLRASTEIASFPTSNTVEVTQTVYTDKLSGASYPVSGFGAQRYLQNRVSYVIADAETADPTRTFYSYDPHGNVEWIGQDLTGMDATKFTRYEYDLISGNVLFVYYNEGYIDEFRHCYSYDDDNRLSEVWTSKRGRLWDRDGAYSYYEHGPLARLEIGEDRVQGLDYVYTVQGWLKGINHPGLQIAEDPGEDAGTLRPTLARDAFGMALGYYKGDYKHDTKTQYNSAGSAAQLFSSTLPNSGQLYNGNIAAWQLGHADRGNLQHGDKQTGYAFRYDDLNRLKNADFHIFTGGSWQAGAGSEYSSAYDYDPNGNITRLRRYAHLSGTQGKLMDDLQYTYNPPGPGSGNQLQRVDDDVNGAGDAARYPGDIDDPVNAGDRYVYSHIGNLVQDLEEDLTIEWTVYGKVSRVTDGDDDRRIDFDYDGAGNRIRKTVTNTASQTTESITWYLRDAQGNVLATYIDKPSAGDKISVEYAIYGSDRLGLMKEDFPKEVGPDVAQENIGYPGTPFTEPNYTIYSRYTQRKCYELQDHLGNVRVVISDVKENTTAMGQVPFEACVLTISNYYPFGMLQPGRSWQSEDYAFGFNGMLKDDDVKGVGNSYDFGARIHDSRLGRFLSIDPLASSFPWQSPYSFAANTPVQAIDADGLFVFYVILEGRAGFVVEGVVTLALAADLEGNMALQLTAGLGAMVGAFAGVGYGGGINFEAETVEDLEGLGFVPFGIAVGDGAGVSFEISIAVSKKVEEQSIWDTKSDDRKHQFGFTAGVGPAVGFGVYAEYNYTWTLLSGSLPELIAEAEKWIRSSTNNDGDQTEEAQPTLDEQTINKMLDRLRQFAEAHPDGQYTEEELSALSRDLETIVSESSGSVTTGNSED